MNRPFVVLAIVAFGVPLLTACGGGGGKSYNLAIATPARNATPAVSFSGDTVSTSHQLNLVLNGIAYAPTFTTTVTTSIKPTPGTTLVAGPALANVGWKTVSKSDRIFVQISTSNEGAGPPTLLLLRPQSARTPVTNPADTNKADINNLTYGFPGSRYRISSLDATVVAAVDTIGVHQDAGSMDLSKWWYESSGSPTSLTFTFTIYSLSSGAPAAGNATTS